MTTITTTVYVPKSQVDPTSTDQTLVPVTKTVEAPDTSPQAMRANELRPGNAGKPTGFDRAQGVGATTAPQAVPTGSSRTNSAASLSGTASTSFAARAASASPPATTSGISAQVASRYAAFALR